MKKRLLAVLLALIMTCSAFVGCNTEKPTESNPVETKPNSGTAEVPEEPVEIKWLGYYVTTGLSVSEDSEVEKLLESKFNVDIIPVTDVTSENFDTFVGSGDIMDITCFVSRLKKDFVELYDQGITRDFPAEWLYEYYPTGMKLLEEFNGKEFYEQGKHLVDGKCLAIPHAVNFNTSRMTVLYRKDWLDNLGLEEPTSLQEFHDMLYAFTYDDPDGNGLDDTYGMEVRWGGYGLWPVYGANGFINFNKSGSFRVMDDGSVVYSTVTEEYKKALSIIEEWYNEGILHPEGLTDDRATLRTKWANGTLGAITEVVCWTWGTDAAQLIPMVELTYGEGSVDMLDPITSEYGGELLGDGRVHTGSYAPGSDLTNDVIFTADATDEQVIAVLKMLEGIVQDPELVETIEAGVEGVDWDLVDGAIVQRPENNEVYKASKGYGTFFRSFVYPEEYLAKYVSQTDFERCINVAAAWPEEVGYTSDPMGSLTSMNEAYGMYFSEIKACEEEFYSNVLLGVVDLESGWDAYVQEMYEIGLGEIIDEYEDLLKG